MDPATLLSQLNQVRAEYEDFQLSSKELEEELERELERTQTESTTWEKKHDSARNEAEQWKSRHGEAMSSIAGLESERDSLKSRLAKDAARIRELEIFNDELESASRAALTSISDLEKRYNATLEKMVFLQEELEATQGLEGDLQRVRDELRDAEIEIGVLRSRGGSPSGTGSPGPPAREPTLSAASLAASLSTLNLSEQLISGVVPGPSDSSPPASQPTPVRTPISQTGANPVPSTPVKPQPAKSSPGTPSAFALVSSVTSASVSAISDLLGKARAIEGRLAAARGESFLSSSLYLFLTVIFGQRNTLLRSSLATVHQSEAKSQHCLARGKRKRGNLLRASPAASDSTNYLWRYQSCIIPPVQSNYLPPPSFRRNARRS